MAAIRTPPYPAGAATGVRYVSGAYVLMFKSRTIVLADTTVNIEPDSETLAEIAEQTAETAKRFNLEPRVAMLSFSNFGSTKHAQTKKVADAVAILLLAAYMVHLRLRAGEIHPDHPRVVVVCQRNIRLAIAVLAARRLVGGGTSRRRRLSGGRLDRGHQHAAEDG